MRLFPPALSPPPSKSPPDGTPQTRTISSLVSSFLRSRNPFEGLNETGSDGRLDVETARIRTAWTVIMIGFIGNVAAAIQPDGSFAVALVMALMALAIVGFVVVHGDTLSLKFLVVAAVAGWLELVTDWAFVDVVPAIVYPKTDPMIGCSPFYMPFAWMMLLWPLGIIVRWLDRQWGLAAAVALGLVIGGVTIPTHEFLAGRAGWWHYRDQPSIAHIPHFIIALEALVVAALPVAFRAVERRGLWVAGLTGVGLGVWIFVAAWVGYGVFGRDV